MIISDNLLIHVGFWVIISGGLLFAAMLFAVFSFIAISIARYYGQRLYAVQDNLRYVHKWRDAGCPKVMSYDPMEES